MKSKLERVIQNDPEIARRIRSKITKAKTCLMNNLKWREVFSMLARSVHLSTPIRWRFVGGDRSYFHRVPPFDGLGLLAERLPDELPSPYCHYREIDWIEIPDSESGEYNDLDELARELSSLGRLPLSRTEGGLRISGYIW